ncbi:MAG: NAD(P)-binding protein [Gammaproteobacteria bacterium]|nr:NAD(P)-binding protein [Gammaproteobacteria bacterium]
MSEEIAVSVNDPLFQPLEIRKIRFRNRIMSTSHACGLEEQDGMPGETYQRYHVEKARGGLGLTMFGGSAYIDADSTWSSGQLNMSTDRIIPYLQSFSQRVHDEGAAIMIQLTHLGRRGETNTQNWLPTIAPSMIRETGHRSFPREMDLNDIQRVVKAFGDGAERAKLGGLDGMETMVGGHLIGQFLSPITNHRNDEFDGSLENRCRFGLMVQQEIRQRVGDDFLVGMRFPIDEAVKGGLGFDDCVEIALMFERSGLIDFFNANYGRLDTGLSLLTDCMPAIASPIAPWLQVAGAFKKEVNLPVFHAARITDLATARYAIKEGLLDMVAMTRAHIADPHIVNKIKRGEENRIRPCVGMTHCMGSNRPTCLHNPSTARENHWPQRILPSPHAGKKAVVVGAGPAGLEAARILAERGHEVTVFEAANEPGGQLRMAARTEWRKDIMGIIDWRVNELALHNIEIQTNQLAEVSDILPLEPDVIIIATGGLPNLEWLEGAQHATSVWDILSGSEPLGESVVVYDGTGRHPGLSAAQFATDRGKNTQLVLLDDRPGAELDYGESVIWRRELAQRNMVPLVEYRLLSVQPRGSERLGPKGGAESDQAGHAGKLSALFEQELTGKQILLHGDQIVVEHGTTPADELYHALRPYASNDGETDIETLLQGRPQPVIGKDSGMQLYRIGDACSSRNVAAGMFDALRLCSVI